MDWILTSFQWYFFTLIIGVFFLPLTNRIFRRFSIDFGYPFARVLAIVFITYATFVLGVTKALPFHRVSLFFIILISVLINFFIVRKNKLRYQKTNFYFIVFEEILFLASFVFWTFIRSQEPSIHSLEKFMDFGFINSILRSDFFPPKDIWYPPKSINYYYFGHMSGAVLIKLTNVLPSKGYNLILSTIFALAMTQVFSFVSNIIHFYKEKTKKVVIAVFGIIGSLIVNLGGNLHTIYLFTKGYPNDNPIPFWKIFSSYNPGSYWYPNATRFIPYTIHEFPSYSYVVADLHGHVFDIPFVLLTLAFLFLMFTKPQKKSTDQNKKVDYRLPSVIFLGFLTAIHYMTNAFDGPIYLLLITAILFLLFGFSSGFVLSLIVLFLSFLFFSLPFSVNFSPFVSGIGVNCSPDFLIKLKKIGPFLFEQGNCQTSPFWMLFVLWGFFWISFVLFALVKQKTKGGNRLYLFNTFFLVLFSFGTFLVIIPEFFYIKDIYPQHFRANTMFKLGYQAFIMMGISSAVTFFLIKQIKREYFWKRALLNGIWIVPFLLVVIYPFYSIPSYYGSLKNPIVLDGAAWLKSIYPEDKEIIDFLNNNIKGQPIVLEAQGDSYTDYERISAYTGLPTVAGWWVHEWLWRGDSNVVGERIPDITSIYQSEDIKETKELLNRYKVSYVVISKLEKEKYPELNEEKFEQIGRLIFRSSNQLGAVYQINQTAY